MMFSGKKSKAKVFRNIPSFSYPFFLFLRAFWRMAIIFDANNLKCKIPFLLFEGSTVDKHHSLGLKLIRDLKVFEKAVLDERLVY